MKLSTWRPSLYAWLQDQILVDGWTLTNPEIGKTHGFLPPLQDVSYKLENYDRVIGKGIQHISIVKRASKDTTYKDLPIDVLEGYHSTLSIRLVHDYADIAELQSLEFQQVDSPINVLEPSGDNPYWVIELMWSFEITWDATPEGDDLNQPFTLNQLNIRLWRDRLDDLKDGKSAPNKRVLDFTFSIGGDEPYLGGVKDDETVPITPIVESPI